MTEGTSIHEQITVGNEQIVSYMLGTTARSIQQSTSASKNDYEPPTQYKPKTRGPGHPRYFTTKANQQCLEHRTTMQAAPTATSLATAATTVTQPTMEHHLGYGGT